MKNKPHTESIQTLTDRLSIFLTAYRYYIDIKSSAGLFDSANFGEPFCRDIARIVYGYTDLENLNFSSGRNFPAIDLGSLQSKTAIQVTLTNKTKKIETTLGKFLKNNLHIQYTNLKVIILTAKQKSYPNSLKRLEGEFKFNPETDILDLNDLFNALIDSSDVKKISDFITRLETELSSKIQPYLLGYDKPAQRFRELFQAHDTSYMNATDRLKQFGVDRKSFYDTSLLSEVVSCDLINYTSEQFAVSKDWLKGDDEHIYSNGPDIELDTGWRRTLAGAYDFITRTMSAGGKLILVIPNHKEISQVYYNTDVVDSREDGYEHFLLLAKDQNEFATARYKVLISDHLSYQKCVKGIFLLFLAAEIIEHSSEKTVYIDIARANRNDILRYYEGDAFVIDAIRDCYFENHKDYLYRSNGNFRLRNGYQDSFVDFLNEQINSAILETATISKINKTKAIPRIKLSL